MTPANPTISKGTTHQFTATGTYSDSSTQNLTGTVTWASATPSVATITAGGLATGVATGTSSISATLGSVSGSTVLTVTTATLQSIAVTPANPSIAKGTTQQFTATGTYSDSSTQNLTGSVTWASATPSVATIAAGGLATGVGVGTSNITASLSGVTSPVDVLTVTTATLKSIAVTPVSPSIAKGTTQQFTATGTYSDSSTQNITSTVTWTSGTTSVATIAAGGLATGVGVGTSNITASLSGVTSPVDVLTVTTATLQSIAVTPTSPSIAKGTTQQFTATGTYSDSSTQNITSTVTWTSGTTSVATIAAGGLATGVGVGTSNITAALSGVTSPVDVLTVTTATLQSIAVTPASPSIAKGTTQQFTATGTYSDSSTQNITSTVTWTSGTTSVATIAAGGLATGVGLGTSNITASLSGVTSPVDVLTVTPATLKSIAVTPISPSIAKGLTQQFTATGTYTDSTTQNLTATATWASATPSVATIAAGGLATGVGAGTSNITASMSGVTSPVDVLTVTGPALQSIAVTPASPSIAKGLTQQFTATGTYSDTSTQNITTSVTWTSATLTVATITNGGSGGLATGVAVGTSNITASLSGVTSPADVLTVTAAALQSIAVTPVSPTIVKGSTQQFTATGTYTDSTTQNLTATATWSSATTSVATIAAGGLATGVSAGTSNITASQGGVTSPIDVLTVNGSPVITNLTPASGAQGATIASVAFSGQFTHFVNGTSVANFGPAITVNSTTITSPTTGSANISISPTAFVGFNAVSVTTGAETATGGSFQIITGPAAISSLTPNSGTQGQTGLSIAIVGSNTHFTNGITSANFAGGATVNTLSITDGTHATAVINVPAGATPGTYTVTLTTQGESASITNGFTVIAGAPVITSVSPNSGQQGQTIATVSVVGQFTHFAQGTTVVSFGSGVTINSVTVSSATTLAVKITISGIAPLGFHNVTATTGAEVAQLVNGFQVLAGNAAIASVTPNNGQQGVSGLSVAIVGTSTNFAQGSTAATFGGGITVTSLTITDGTHATALLTIPATASTGPVNVTLTTGGEIATLNNGFTITAGTPTISSISPLSAHQGDPPLNVSVVGEFTSFVQGTTTASFGPGITVNSVTVTDSTHATVNITVSTTAATGFYNVTMTTGTQVATLTNGFTVLAGVPALISVTPNQGSQGASLTVQLNGQFTHFTQGTTTVSFGSGITAGTVTVNGPGTASVPITITNGTASGPRSVTVTTGTEVVTLSSGFTVQAGTPAVTLISPNYGVPNSSLTVNLTGQFTNWVNGTTTASFGPNISVNGAANGAAGVITVTSLTTASASLVIANGATLQGQTVTVTTGAEVEQVINGFTVQNTGTTPPTIISFSPPYGATNVPLNVALTAEWSEPMDRTTFTATNFYLYDTVTAVNIPATITVDASGRISTLTPTKLLAVDRTYYVYIGYGSPGIKDALGNLFGSGFYVFTTGFTTDTSGPSFVTSNIAAGATGVPLNAPVVLQFSSAIDPPTQPAGVQITTGGTAVNGTYAFDTTQTILTFKPAAALTASTVYKVTYTAALTDEAGNALTNPGNFTFTTGTAADTTGPSVISTDPAASATGVGTNAILRVTFNKPVDPTTITSSNFILYNANGFSTTYPVTIAVAADRLSATFTPVSPLLNLTQFYWQLSSFLGENGVSDSGGVGQYFTTGTTADTTAAHVTSISPINGATGVPVNTQVTTLFSEMVDATSVTNTSISLSPSAAGTAKLSGDQLSLVFTPTANLSVSTVYTVSISGLRDTEGNALAAFSPTTFTTSSSSTADKTAPSVTSFVPASGATGVALNSTITININKPINPATVRTDTNNSTDSLAVFMTPSGGSQSQVAGTFTVTNTNTTSQIVFTPNSPFEPNSSVTVYVVYYTYITDYAGNNINGTNESFTTATGTDTTAPVVTSVTPPNGATAVGQNTPVVLTFSKPLNPSTVNSTNFHLFNGSTPLSTGVTRSSDSLTVTLTASLPSGALINVIATHGVTDLVGNPLADFSSSFTAATLPSSTHPSVVTMIPGSSSTGIPGTSPITLIMSASMNSSSITGALNIAQNGVLVSGTTKLDANGQTITFTPSAPFAPSALVQVFLSTAATDIYGNTLNGNFVGSFTVQADQTTAVPTVVSLSPTYGANINVLNPVIDVRFSTPINPSTVTNSTFYVMQSDSVAINGALSLLDPYTIHFVPSPRTLTAGPYYRINMTSGIQGSNGVSFVGSVGTYYFYIAGTATLVDTVSPTVTGLAPTDGSTVGDNTIFRATFSKPVDPLSVNSTTFMVSGGGQTVMPSSISFDSANQNVTITPQMPLPDSAAMTIAINGITDISGNAVTPLTVHFTTLAGADITQPTVVSTSVLNGAVNVPINSAITFVFSKPMDSRTLTGTNFNIYDYTLGTYVPVNYSYSSNGLTATLTPSSPLAVGRQYNFAVNTAQDLEGNTIVGISYNFTTAYASSSTPPTVVDSTPKAGATGIPTNATIQVLFSEAVQANTLGSVKLLLGGPTGTPQTVTPSLSNGGTLITLTPGSLLLPAVQYTISITGVADLAGNVMTSTVTKSFTTGPGINLIGPSIVAISPASGETNVPTNAVLHVTFSAPINQLSLSNANFQFYSDAQSRYLPGTVTVNPNGLSATLVPVTPLLPNNEYQLIINSYYDLAGNIGGGDNVSFTTGASTNTSSPTVTAISPASGATGVGENALIVAKLSAPLDPTTIGNSSITLTPAVAGTVTLGTDQETLTLTPTGHLAASTPYSVQVTGFTDLSGNAVTTFTSTFTTSATTDITDPTVTSTVPNSGTSGVALNTTITININDQINPTTVVTDTQNIDTLAVFAQVTAGNFYVGGTATVTNNNVTNTSQIVFTPSSALPPSATINVYVGYNAYMRDFENNLVSYSFNFTTASGTDTTPPTVTSVTPTNGATGVGPYTIVSLTLSKPLNPTTITGNTFSLYNGSTRISPSISHSADNRTVMLNYAGQLPGNSLITVEATNAATDYAGNPLTPFTSSFMTASIPSNSNPSVISQRPGNGATGVPANTPLYLITNKAMNAATIAGALHVSVNGSLITGSVTVSPGGTSILFTPSAQFAFGGFVQINLNNTATDSDGNPLNAYNGSFTVQQDQSTVAPTFVAMNPSYGSTNQPLNSVVDVEFSKPMDATTVTTGNIYLEENDATLVSASVSLIFPNVIRITPSAAFASGSNYYRLEMPANGLKDTNGNFFAGSIGTYYFYTGATSITDTTAPTITTLAPANNSTNIGDNAVIQIGFSKPIDPLTINGTSVKVTGGSSTVMPASISFNSTSQIATITPFAPLPDSTMMTIAISGVTDTSGNTVTPQSTTFTTGLGADTTAPFVIASSVDSLDTTNVPQNTVFTVKFSKPMDTQALLVSTNFYLYDYTAGGVYLTGVTRSFSSDGTTAFINPTGLLSATHLIQLGVFNATDLTGNVMNGFSVNFTVSSTSDTAPPTVIATNPGGTVNPPTNSVIQALFNKSVQATSLSQVTLKAGGPTIPVTASLSNGDQTLTITPGAPLSPSTAYTVTITGVNSTAGVAMASPVVFSFTTAAGAQFTGTAALSTVPANGATGIATSVDPTVTFSNPIDPASAYAAIVLQNNSTSVVVPSTLSFSTDFRTVTITPNVALSSTTTYRINSQFGVYVTDQAGTNATAYVMNTFTTGP